MYKSSLQAGNIKEIEKYIEEIVKYVADLQLYFKHYIDINKRGKKVYCFNDREWRYIPVVVYKMFCASENPNTDYQHFLNAPKPHIRDVKLDFILHDIEFIMVRHNHQIKGIVKTLIKRFGENKVMSAILNGELTIFSFEKLYNSI